MTQTTERRPDASMSLLREVMEHPLDPGYTEAAERRARGESTGSGRRRVGRRLLVLVLSVAIGLGGVWAARELRNPPPEENARTVLIEQIRQRTEEGAALTAANAELRGEIESLQAAAFGDAAADAIAQARGLGILAGTTAVVGPGMRITMSDSASAQAGEPNSEDGFVQDFDLQVVVNALWASGAEAIAINGVRLTGATAIRTAGDAVLVDLQPLSSPYVIEAIGDQEAMRTAFARTTGASHLAWLAANVGISSEQVLQDEMLLPAGSPPPVTVVEATE